MSFRLSNISSQTHTTHYSKMAPTWIELATLEMSTRIAFEIGFTFSFKKTLFCVKPIPTNGFARVLYEVYAYILLKPDNKWLESVFWGVFHKKYNIFEWFFWKELFSLNICFFQISLILRSLKLLDKTWLFLKQYYLDNALQKCPHICRVLL